MSSPERNNLALSEKKSDPLKYSEFEVLDVTENQTIDEIDDIEAMDQRVPDSLDDDDKQAGITRQNYQMQYVQQTTKKLQLGQIEPEIGNPLQLSGGFPDRDSIKKGSKKSSQRKQKDQDTSDEESSDLERSEEDGSKVIDNRKTIVDGSFLQSVILLKRRLIGVEDVIEQNQGLRLLHYACYFGKIKALKALVEIFKADINAVDYRG